MSALYQKGDETIQARRQLLVEQREQLIERIREMNETLERRITKLTPMSATPNAGHESCCNERRLK